jgi:hypothetical protein
MNCIATQLRYEKRPVWLMFIVTVVAIKKLRLTNVFRLAKL